MSLSLRAAIVLYCLVGALLVLGGANYVFSAEYLGYHEEATGIPWSALSPELQGTFLGLMQGGGAGSITVGLALILASVVGLRRQVAMAFWMAPLLALTYLVLLNYGSYTMVSTTPGGPPMQVGLTLVALVVAAAVLSHLGREPTGSE